MIAVGYFMTDCFKGNNLKNDLPATILSEDCEACHNAALATADRVFYVIGGEASTFKYDERYNKFRDRIIEKFRFLGAFCDDGKALRDLSLHSDGLHFLTVNEAVLVEMWVGLFRTLIDMSAAATPHAALPPPGVALQSGAAATPHAGIPPPGVALQSGSPQPRRVSETRVIHDLRPAAAQLTADLPEDFRPSLPSSMPPLNPTDCKDPRKKPKPRVCETGSIIAGMLKRMPS